MLEDDAAALICFAHVCSCEGAFLVFLLLFEITPNSILHALLSARPLSGQLGVHSMKHRLAALDTPVWKGMEHALSGRRGSCCQYHHCEDNQRCRQGPQQLWESRRRPLSK